jgi:hypothetical protein
MPEILKRRWVPASAGADFDHDIPDLDALASMDLAGLSQLDGAVHPHRAAGDQMLARATAVADTGEFEQLIEFDVIAVEFEEKGRHVRIAMWRRLARPVWRSITSLPENC